MKLKVSGTRTQLDHASTQPRASAKTQLLPYAHGCDVVTVQGINIHGLLEIFELSLTTNGLYMSAKANDQR
jgi:hypothetical protein